MIIQTLEFFKLFEVLWYILYSLLQLWLRNLLWEVNKKEELFFKNYFFRWGGGGVNYFFFQGGGEYYF